MSFLPLKDYFFCSRIARFQRSSFWAPLQSVLNNAIPIVVMGAMVFFSAIAFTSRSINESLLTVCSYFFCILLGYIYGKVKNDDWVESALLMLRNVMVFACLFSFVLEIVLGQRLVTNGSFSFLQTVTIDNPSLYRLRSFSVMQSYLAK